MAEHVYVIDVMSTTQYCTLWMPKNVDFDLCDTSEAKLNTYSAGIIINGKRCFCVLTVHIANVNWQDSVKFQLETFFQPLPEFVLKFVLNFQPISEPHPS